MDSKNVKILCFQGSFLFFSFLGFLVLILSNVFVVVLFLWVFLIVPASMH
jgi:hypothetical protein